MFKSFFGTHSPAVSTREFPSPTKPVSEMTDDEYYALYPHASGLPTMRFFYSSGLAHTEEKGGALVVVPRHLPIEIPLEPSIEFHILSGQLPRHPR